MKNNKNNNNRIQRVVTQTAVNKSDRAESALDQRLTLLNGGDPGGLVPSPFPCPSPDCGLRLILESVAVPVSITVPICLGLIGFVNFEELEAEEEVRISTQHYVNEFIQLALSPRNGFKEEDYVKRLLEIRDMSLELKGLEPVSNIKQVVNLPNSSASWEPVLKQFILASEKLLFNFTKYFEKGFINELGYLPGLADIVSLFKLDNDHPNNVELNRLLYQLILLIMKFKAEYFFSKAQCYNASESFDDLLNDLRGLCDRLEALLEVSIRRRLVKRGLIIQQNVYVGFDTEYELLDPVKNLNELLSVQIAGNSRLIVKVPVVTPYRNEYVNPLTSEVDLIGRKHPPVLVDSIDYYIRAIRALKFEGYEASTRKLIATLSKIEGVQMFDSSSDQKVFVYGCSERRTLIKLLSSYSMKDLIRDVDHLMTADLTANTRRFAKDLGLDSSESLEKAFSKRSSRLSVSFDACKFYVTTRLNLIIAGHLSQADLSMLSDFESFKESLSVINGSLVTLGKCLKFVDPTPVDSKRGRASVSSTRFSVVIRDTILLSPAGCKGLADVGRIYGESYNKIDIGRYRGRMKALLSENESLFRQYALRDSEITLKHMNEMENFYITLNNVGIPLTLSSISKAFVKREWAAAGYKGYQMDNGFYFGKLSTLFTPKGINACGVMGLTFMLGLSSLRGGRNESYMYGVDRWSGPDAGSKGWYDYDFSGAYPTAMASLGNPYYKAAEVVDDDWMSRAKAGTLINSYTVVRVEFEFPESVKYPNIPTQVLDDNTIYPLKGVSNITGLEYLLARNLGCRLKVLDGYSIPFENAHVKRWKTRSGEWMEDGDERREVDGFLSCYNTASNFKKLPDRFSSRSRNNPFSSLVRDLVLKRVEHKKGTFLNMMYKQIVNSIYGLTVMGQSSKRKMDLVTGASFVLEGSDLSNPFIGGYITAFVRTVLSECLNNIARLNGKVVSSTTDGFITDLANIEEVLMKEDFKHTLFLRVFKVLRGFVVGGSNAQVLELKNHEGAAWTGDDTELGIVSWGTRGQLGFTSGIKAHTGFQSSGVRRQDHLEMLIHQMESDNTFWEYIQNSLRSAKDVYLKGGHVTLVFKDQSFRVTFDNKRLIVEPEGCYSLTNTLLDSKPWEDVTAYAEIKEMDGLISRRSYNHILTRPSGKKYRSQVETGIRTFIKSLFLEESESFGVSIKDFANYKDVIEFLNAFEGKGKIRISKSSISNLRNRRVVVRTVPKSDELNDFVQYVKSRFPGFNQKGNFFKGNGN